MSYSNPFYSTLRSVSTRISKADYVVFMVVIVMLLAFSQSLNAQIFVFAGDDTTICYASNLDIEELEATISGDVSDGNWFTTGDGVFLPSGNTMSTFSITTGYVPGVQDQANGIFGLILVSDDPDGIGPMIEVSDNVNITFQSAPALACNNNINVTLDVQCEQELFIDMLVPNPVEPVDKYIIESFDEDGVLILDNLLTGAYIGQEISYTVGHECTLVTCSGTLMVTDNYAPVFICVDTQIVCDQDNTADVIGLPIPDYAVAIADGENEYIVTDWDACGEVALSYTDTETIPSCSTPLDKIINRTWIATDPFGNTSFCAQSILVERITVDEVVFPPHFDGNDEPSLDCDINFETDDNGNPSTSITGIPSPNTCNHLDFLYTDTVIPLCGGSYKVLRAWEVIDWCLVETAAMNQVIKVDDFTAPTFLCVEDITISTSVYNCETSIVLLDVPNDISDCSDYEITAIVQSDSGIDTYPVIVNQGQLTIDNLPLGSYEIIYALTDECDNTSTCNAKVIVIDDVEPYPICDEFTSVSISLDGTARVFAAVLDDGSSDNCEIVSYQVAKMTDECGFGLDFGDYIDICCEEVNDTVFVALQVTDASGNSNTCMVSVIIEDNIAPEITAPSDLTLACDTYYDLEDMSPFGVVRTNEIDVLDIIINDAYNNGVAGQDGFYIENCTATVEESIVASVDCYEGIIERTFTVTDEFGMASTAIQIIVIQNADVIQESDIEWPIDIEAVGCQDIEADTSMTGVPVLSSVTCGAIAFQYYDEIFPIADTACMKIIRHWTAIDWCQHNPDTGEGYWTDNQVIKLSNNIAPIIENCIDAEVCSYDDDCMTAEYSFDLIAGDDCTDTLLLQYEWEIDFDKDGFIDVSGNGPSIDVTVVHGIHQVFWSVFDACGNVTSCDYNITVKDCKAPTPFCFSSITTVLMPTNGQVTIWAEDFDFGSNDNCTDVSELQFSFSENVDDTSWTIDCEDIENGVIQWFSLDMYVTDADGNHDYCTVQIVIQDNDDYCMNENPDGIIKGNLRTTDGERIEGAEVEYKDMQEIAVDTTMSNAGGKYTTDAAFDNVPYFVTPRKMDELTNGVTSLDLVLIQRHVLGFSEFSDPYQIIASDMNASNSVSSADIVLLRKVILGIKSELPNDNMPWRFIPEGWTFMDEASPWDYDQNIYLEPLVDTVQQINFTAVKLGDVNGSYESFTGTENVEPRNEDTYYLTSNYTTEADMLTLSLTTNEELSADASQMTIEFDARAMYPLSVIDQDGNLIPEDYYNISNGVLTILNGYVTPKQILENTVLYTIEFELTESRAYYQFDLAKDYHNVIYEGEYPYQLMIDKQAVQVYTEDDQENGFYLLSNPSSKCVILNDLTLDSPITLSVLDATGRKVFDSKFQSSVDMIEVPAKAFVSNGLYFISIQSNICRTVLEYLYVE